MKMLTTFEPLATLTSESEAAGYPDDNVKDLDPGLTWRPTGYAGDVWLKVDFGSAKTLTALFLNRCNFPHAHIQGHASDDWGSPSYDVGFNLGLDEAGNRKAWCALTAFNYRWLRILIPGAQTLDSGTVPEVGNAIAGAAVTLPLVKSLDWEIAAGKVDAFRSDRGNLRKNYSALSGHSISLEVGDTLANVKAWSKTWTHGVLFADLGSVENAWLVYRPERWRPTVRNSIDAGCSCSMDERT